MINWRNGKAAFVGASRYIIKGFFEFQHSKTSEDVVVPSDVTFGVFGAIDAGGIGIRGSISSSGQGVLGRIDNSFGISSIIDSDGLGIQGDVNDRGKGIIGKIK